MLFQSEPETRATKEPAQSVGEKRHKPIVFEKDDKKPSPEKRARSERDGNVKMYIPPSGKYSDRFSGTSEDRGERRNSGGGFQGRWKHRGGGRNNRNFSRGGGGGNYRKNTY